MIRPLLQAKADIHFVNPRGFPCLSYIWCRVRSQKAEVPRCLSILSGEGFDHWNAQDTIGWTPMHRAAMAGTYEDLCLLTETYRATPDVETYWRRWKPVHCSVIYSNHSTFNFFCALEDFSVQGFYPDEDSWTLLHHAAQRGNLQMLVRILEMGGYKYLSAETDPSKFKPLLPDLKDRALTPRDIAIGYGNQAVFDEAVRIAKHSD